LLYLIYFIFIFFDLLVCEDRQVFILLHIANYFFSIFCATLHIIPYYIRNYVDIFSGYKKFLK